MNLTKKPSNPKTRRAIGCLLAVAIALVGVSPANLTLSNLPSAIHLTQGDSTQISLPSVIQAQVLSGDACAISELDETISEADPSYTLTGEAPGNAQLVLKLLGLPVKTVNVDVAPERTVMPGGQSIGVAINMGGALVVGSSDIGPLKSPAREAGLKAGDRIVAVDGRAVANAAALSKMLSAQSCVLSVIRDGLEHLLPITPIRDARDGCFKLGAWVRDSTAGVGTLSFYDPQTGKYGALGHAITDVDTGTLLPVGEGYIYESHIVDVLRGESGEPGELMGEFFSEDHQLGTVTDNSELGLYGEADAPMINPIFPNGVKLAHRSEVKTGAAQILTTIGDSGMRLFDCEIVKLYHQDSAAPRSMVVKITDEELLGETGGIVQGMSGSPLIQGGKLIGAVTHVFINDPTQGYGLYADWMIDKAEAAGR